MSSMSTEQFARNASASKSGETARLERRLASLADAGPTAIDERLAKLEWEWTAGRLTKVALGTVIVLGLGLTALLNPWWMILPTVAGLLLLQYCFLKTSWLAQIFRSFGYRCGSEVENEKIALKVLRGDFRTVPTVLDVENHDDISRFEGEGGLVAEPDDTKVEPKDAARMVLEATGRM